MFPVNPFKAPISEQVEKIHLVSKTLQAEGIKHWIDFGTLLGAVRNGGFVESDVDFDINILKHDRGRLLGLRNKLLAETNILLIDAPVIRGCPLHELLRTDDDFQAINSCMNAGLIYIDFYECEVREKDVFHVLTPYSFKSYFIDELEEVRFEGLLFPAPAHGLDLLLHRYGADWRTPIALNEFKRIEFECIIPFTRQTTAYVAWAFEYFEEEDIAMLKKGKELFDKLIVGVQPDNHTRGCQEASFAKHSEIIAAVSNCKLVDEVIADVPLVITQNFMERNGIDYILSWRKIDGSFLYADEIILHQKLHNMRLVIGGK